MTMQAIIYILSVIALSSFISSLVAMAISSKSESLKIDRKYAKISKHLMIFGWVLAAVSWVLSLFIFFK